MRNFGIEGIRSESIGSDGSALEEEDTGEDEAGDIHEIEENSPSCHIHIMEPLSLEMNNSDQCQYQYSQKYDHGNQKSCWIQIHDMIHEMEIHSEQYHGAERDDDERERIPEKESTIESAGRGKVWRESI